MTDKIAIINGPKLNTLPAAPVEGLEKVRPIYSSPSHICLVHDDYVTRSQAEGIIAVLKKDRLPAGHEVLEQADIHDGTGRISQTVFVEATGEEYERIVHSDEAYGEDE